MPRYANLQTFMPVPSTKHLSEADAATIPGYIKETVKRASAELKEALHPGCVPTGPVPNHRRRRGEHRV